ncbi:translocation/assembly module TamB domain-containing protein [Thermodesulfobacteriota bacterium]
MEEFKEKNVTANRNRWIKFGIRLLLYPLLLLAIGIACGFLYLQTETGQNKIKKLAEEAVEGSLNARLRVGKISGDLLFTLSFEEISISGKDGPLLEANRISVNYLSPLLLRKIVFIREAQIDGLFLNLIKAGDGTWNLTSLFPQREPEKAASPETHDFKFILNRISVNDTQVVFTEKTESGSISRHFKNIQLDAWLHSATTLSANISKFSFDLDQPRFILKKLNGLVFYRPEQPTLDFNKIRIQTEKSDLTLKGSLALKSSDPVWSLHAAINALSLSEVGQWLSLKELDQGIVEGSLTANGIPKHFSHQLDLKLDQLNVRTAGDIVLNDARRLELDVSGNIRNLNPATLPFKHPVKIAGNLNGDITLKGDNLNLPSRKGKVTITFQESRLLDQVIEGGSLKLAFQEKDLTIEEGRFLSPAGRIDIYGAIMGVLDPISPKNLDLAAFVEDFDLAAINPGQEIRGKINLDLKAKASLPQGKLNLTDMTAGVIVQVHPSNVESVEINEGYLTANWRNQLLILDHFDLVTSAGQISLVGTAMPMDKDFQGQIHLILPDLVAVMPLVSQMIPQTRELENLAGSLEIFTELKSWRGGPVFTATVLGSDIQYEQMSAKTLTLKSEWQGFPKNFANKSELQIEDFTIQDNYFPMVDLKALLSPANAFLETQIKYHSGEEIEMTGKIEDWLKPTKTIVCSALKLKALDMEWSNKDPLRLTVSPNGLDISAFYLTTEQVETFLSGQISWNGKLSLSAQLKNLDLNRITSILPNNARPNGRVSADLNIAGNWESPVIHSRFLVEEGFVYDIKFYDLDLHFHYAQSQAILKGDLFQENKKILTAEGSSELNFSLFPFSFDLLSGEIDLQLETKDLKISSLPIPPIAGMNYDGLIDLRARLSGNMNSPRLEGNLAVKDGFLNFKKHRLNYTDLEGKFRFSDEKIMVDRLSVKDSREGVLTCSGELLLDGIKPSVFDIRLTGENFHIPYQRAIYGKIQPDLRLSGDIAAPILSGNLSINEARLYLDRLSVQQTTEVQIINNETSQNGEIEFSEPDIEGPGFLDPLAADVTVTVPHNTWLKGQGLNTEIAGQINLKKDPGGPYRLLGSLNTVRGLYMFQGKRFKISKGTVTFIGLEEPNPNLDIKAVYRVKKVDIIVNITGTAKAIKLSLDSDPVMDEEDVISYLVFGQPTKDLKNQEALNVQKAALNISGVLSGGDMNNAIEETFHIDSLAIDTGDGDIGEGSVSVGKYFTPDVFVNYRQGFNVNEINELEVTYKINRSLNLEVFIGDEKTSGIDFTWEYDF